MIPIDFTSIFLSIMCYLYDFPGSAQHGVFFSSRKPPIPRFRICFDGIDIPELGSMARCFSSYVHIFGQVVRLTWITYNLCLKHFVLGSFTILVTL